MANEMKLDSEKLAKAMRDAADVADLMGAKDVAAEHRAKAKATELAEEDARFVEATNAVLKALDGLSREEAVAVLEEVMGDVEDFFPAEENETAAMQATEIKLGATCDVDEAEEGKGANRNALAMSREAFLSAMGWHRQQMGGGCTAWMRYGAAGRYWLLTDDDDPVTTELTGAVLVGEYNANDDQEDARTFATVAEAVAFVDARRS